MKIDFTTKTDHSDLAFPHLIQETNGSNSK